MSDLNQLHDGMRIGAIPDSWNMTIHKNGLTGRPFITLTIDNDKWTVEPVGEHGVQLVPPTTLNNDKLVRVVSSILLTTTEDKQQ